MYDFLMRLPLLGWVFLCAMGQLTGLVQYMNTMNGLPIDFVYVIHLAMRFSTIAFLLLLAAAVILRSRPSTKASGLEPRVSALVGTLLVYGIALFPRRDLSLPAEMISTSLIIIGSLGAIVALSQLGRSFSVMAETRQLVTSGLITTCGTRFTSPKRSQSLDYSCSSGQHGPSCYLLCKLPFSCGACTTRKWF